VWISATNGTAVIRVEKDLVATTQAGRYRIEAVIQYKDTVVSGSAQFTIR
jgi:hypothetical protein